MKRIISSLITLAVLISLMIFPAGAVDHSFSDTTGHWADTAIQRWSGYGIIHGYDGLFRPDAPITRGETAVILDGLMQYQTAAVNEFTDLGESFYTEAILKANAAGVMLGYNNRVSPEANITRQDAFVMIARALHIQADDGYTIQANDANDIADYARDAMAAMESLGMIQGPGDGKLYPRSIISRAELVQVLDNIVGGLCFEAGTYSEDIGGYVIINQPDVVLENVAITGTLVIAPGVGDGDCTLRNVTVTGSVVVLGGGTNSVKFLGTSSVSGTIYIKRTDGAVRVYSEEGIELPAVIVEDGSDEITLYGVFDSVVIEADTTVTLPAGTTVHNLTINVPAEIAGSGTVEHAVLTEAASNTILEMIPQTTTVPKGITVVINGDPILSDGNVIDAEDVDSSGGAGGGAGGGGATVITVNAVTVYLSNGSSVNATPSGTVAAVNLTSYPDSVAITDIQVTTSTKTTYYVGTDYIPTNQKVSVATMMAMKGLDVSSVSLGRLRAFDIEVPGTVTGCGALTVIFNTGTLGYYNITISGSMVTAELRADTDIETFKTSSGLDPIALLVKNLSNQTGTLYKFTATKGEIRASTSYSSYAEIESLTLDSLIGDMDHTYTCSKLSDLIGITFELTDGTETVYLIMSSIT